MRILWHSVPSAYKTGYGTQTKLWTRRLKRDHTVAISAIVGGMPTYTNEDGIPTLSSGPRNCFGNDFIQAHTEHFKPDMILSCSDTFIYDTNKVKRLPWVAWNVIDAAPLLTQIGTVAKTFKHNLAMCRFGQDALKQAGIESTYIPLAGDMRDDWYLGDPFKARAQLSTWWKMPINNKQLLIVMNAANMSAPSRKNFGAALKAFRIVVNVIPDAILYVHTETTGKLTNGQDIVAMADTEGIPEGNLIFPNQYQYNTGMFDTDYLRTIYQAADTLLVTSMGEGFCLPIIEAYGCGCRVIAPAYSSMVELVASEDQVHEGVLWSHLPGSNQFIVDHAAVAKRLIECQSTCKPIDYYRTLAEPYDLERVYNLHFKPFIAKIEKGEICLKSTEEKPDLKSQAPAQSAP